MKTRRAKLLSVIVIFSLFIGLTTGCGNQNTSEAVSASSTGEIAEAATTEATNEDTEEASTVSATEAATEAITEASTEALTEDSTESVTEASTEETETASTETTEEAESENTDYIVIDMDPITKYVNTAAHVRSGPDTSYPTLGTYSLNQAVKVDGYVDEYKGQQTLWYEVVRQDGSKAFVSASLLSDQKVAVQSSSSTTQQSSNTQAQQSTASSSNSGTTTQSTTEAENQAIAEAALQAAGLTIQGTGQQITDAGAEQSAANVEWAKHSMTPGDPEYEPPLNWQ